MATWVVWTSHAIGERNAKWQSRERMFQKEGKQIAKVQSGCQLGEVKEPGEPEVAATDGGECTGREEGSSRPWLC